MEATCRSSTTPFIREVRRLRPLQARRGPRRDSVGCLPTRARQANQGEGIRNTVVASGGGNRGLLGRHLSRAGETRSDRTARGMKTPRLAVGLLPILLLLGVAPAAHTAPPWNVGYRRIEVQDPLTGGPFPVALWYPTSAEPAPLFVTDSLSPCGLPAMLCRWIAFEMLAALDSPPAAGQFGLIVISHGAGGLAVNHRGLAMVL